MKLNIQCPYCNGILEKDFYVDECKELNINEIVCSYNDYEPTIGNFTQRGCKGIFIVKVTFTPVIEISKLEFKRLD